MKLLREGLRWLAVGLVLTGCVVGLAGLNGVSGGEGDTARVLAAFLRFVILAATGVLVGLGAERLLAESATRGKKAPQRKETEATTAATPSTTSPAREEPTTEPSRPAETTAEQRTGRSSRRRRSRRRPNRSTTSDKARTDASSTEHPSTTSPSQPLRLTDVVYPGRDRSNGQSHS